MTANDDDAAAAAPLAQTAADYCVVSKSPQLDKTASISKQAKTTTMTTPPPNPHLGGVRSRRVRRLRHPLESIGRRLVVAYALALLFRLLAFSTGPLLSSLAHLATRLVELSALASYKAANCFSSAKIRLSGVVSSAGSGGSGAGDDGDGSSGAFRDDWSLCPLNAMELYLLEPLNLCVAKVSTTIAANAAPTATKTTTKTTTKGTDKRSSGDDVYVRELRQLFRDRVLHCAKFRKFSAQVAWHSLVGCSIWSAPFWKHLELADDDADSVSVSLDSINSCSSSKSCNSTNSGSGYGNDCKSASSSSSSSSSLSSLSSTLSTSSAKQVQFASHHRKLQPNSDFPEATTTTQTTNSQQQQQYTRLKLAEHIFVDSQATRKLATAAFVRHYARTLLDERLDARRPLWEIRLLRSKHGYYALFRCAQCLADGATLQSLLALLLADTSSKAAPTLTTQASNSKPSTSQQQQHQQHFVAPSTRVSFIARANSKAASRATFLVGPLSVLLWLIWAFTRRVYNHLKPEQQLPVSVPLPPQTPTTANDNNDTCSSQQTAHNNQKSRQTNENTSNKHSSNRRLYFSHYDLTRLFQIKQLTKSTCADLLVFALSGALREYLRVLCNIRNPPNLGASLAVDMRSARVKANVRQKKSDTVTTVQDNVQKDKHLNNNTNDKHKTNYVDDDDHDDELVKTALVNLPLPTNTEGAVPRLWQVRRLMRELRASVDPWIMVAFVRVARALLPASFFRPTVNFLLLRNSSALVSVWRGPNLRIESWCVDLLRKTLAEELGVVCSGSGGDNETGASDSISGGEDATLANPPSPQQPAEVDGSQDKQRDAQAEKSAKRLELRNSYLKLDASLGHITQLFHLLEPPSSQVPISLSCVSFRNKLFVTCHSKSVLISDSKLLLRLLFAQLDQLASTVAKRRIVHVINAAAVAAQPATASGVAASAAVVGHDDVGPFGSAPRSSSCNRFEPISKSESEDEDPDTNLAKPDLNQCLDQPQKRVDLPPQHRRRQSLAAEGAWRKTGIINNDTAAFRAVASASCSATALDKTGFENGSVQAATGVGSTPMVATTGTTTTASQLSLAWSLSHTPVSSSGCRLLVPQQQQKQHHQEQRRQNRGHMSRSDTDLSSRNIASQPPPTTNQPQQLLSANKRRPKHAATSLDKIAESATAAAAEAGASGRQSHAPVTDALHKQLNKLRFGRRRKSIATSIGIDDGAVHVYAASRQTFNLDLEAAEVGRQQAEAPLRCARRFSAISAGTSSSLLPFGLISNTSLPKLFRETVDQPETHL